MKLRAAKLLNPWLIFSAWLILWAGRLLLVPAYYQRTLELDYYPPEADSIAIPIAANGMATILFAPVFAGLLWLLLRRSPIERRMWLAWNRKRWVISLAGRFFLAHLRCLFFVHSLRTSGLGSS